ncbi:MAG: peptidase M19, partial [Mucilaginibacter polytrichastri]|nr:peptidase M19 [Mucilaginibacter polytrichastri]
MFNIDFHCHPDMKPYGRSFGKNIGKNSTNPKDDNSVWHADLPNVKDKMLHSLAGLVKFTQADMTTLLEGNVHVICASLYPIERNFFNNALGEAIVADLTSNLATGVGNARINDVQCCTDYFSDLNRIYNYYRELDGKEISTVYGPAKYKLVKNYGDIKPALADPVQWQKTIFVVLSIEGMHVLNSNLTLKQPEDATIMANLNALKKWPHPPLFVTLAHHFFNFLCGQAKSLEGSVGKVADQSNGLNDGITPLGYKVIRELLNPKTGRRIYIDIKHMSAKSRREYMLFLSDNFPGE